MVIYKPGDVLSRQDCSLKTASRLGNIKRNILFQNTNGNKLVRDAQALALGLFGPVAKPVYLVA